ALLDASAKATGTDAGKLHEALLAAESVRVHGGGDETLWARWEQARALGAGDVRVVMGRAALALSREQMASDALRVPEAPELAPVAQAMESALRLRGVEVGLEATGERPALTGVNDAKDDQDDKGSLEKKGAARSPDGAAILRRARTALSIGQPVLAA